MDASAAVKRYSPETGSAWIKTLTDPAVGHTIILGEITQAEVAAALAAKHRVQGGITRKEGDDALQPFCAKHSFREETALATAGAVSETASLDRF